MILFCQLSPCSTWKYLSQVVYARRCEIKSCSRYPCLWNSFDVDNLLMFAWNTRIRSTFLVLNEILWICEGLYRIFMNIARTWLCHLTLRYICLSEIRSSVFVVHIPKILCLCWSMEVWVWWCTWTLHADGLIALVQSLRTKESWSFSENVMRDTTECWDFSKLNRWKYWLTKWFHLFARQQLSQYDSLKTMLLK